jgi:hypothetical protein
MKSKMDSSTLFQLLAEIDQDQKIQFGKFESAHKKKKSTELVFKTSAKSFKSILKRELIPVLILVPDPKVKSR